MPTWSMPLASNSAIVSSVAEQGGLRQPERSVLRLGVGVLELEDAEAREGLAHARREQTEPAVYRDHDRQELPPDPPRGSSDQQDPRAPPRFPAHGARDLVAHQPVPHQLAGVDDEV